MKFLFCTDQHIHNFTDFSKPDDEYGTDRLKEQIDALQEVFDIARENEATVIFGGDLFHKRGSVRVEVFNKVFETIAKNDDVQVYMLRGNHDSTTNSLYTESSIEPFNSLENVKVVSEPEVLTDEGVNLVLIPYGDEVDEMKKFIKENSNPSMPNILVGHFGVDGATQGKHSHRLGGAFGYGDLCPDKYDFILLGHYHKRQTIGDNPNHFYGGSFMQHNFGDEGQEKGVHLIDTETKTTKFIPIKTRQFVTIKGSHIPDNTDELIENHFVRFVGSAKDLKTIEKLQKTGVSTDGVRLELQRDYTHEARLGLDTTMSETDIVKKYAEEKFPKSTEKALECLSEVI